MYSDFELLLHFKKLCFIKTYIIAEIFGDDSGYSCLLTGQITWSWKCVVISRSPVLFSDFCVELFPVYQAG